MEFVFDKITEKLVPVNTARSELNYLRQHLTRHVKGYAHDIRYKRRIWDGKESVYSPKGINMGLWKECHSVCKEMGYQFSIKNKEDFPIDRDVTLEKVTEFCKRFFAEHTRTDKKTGQTVPFFPHDHQIETAFGILKHRYCMAEVATSGGKSLIISIVMFYILEHIDPNAKFLLIVPSISLVTQFYDSILEYNYGGTKLKEHGGDIDKLSAMASDTYRPMELRLEEIMSQKPRKHDSEKDTNVYIGTYQSLCEYPDSFFDKFHMVAVDEAHGAKAETLLDILGKTMGKAKLRFGVSGTFPSHKSFEILLIQSVLGPMIANVKASTLVQKEIIAPMDIKVLMLHHKPTDTTKQLMQLNRLGGGSEVYRLERELVQNSVERMNFLVKLAIKSPSNTLLLFHTIEYGKRIYEELAKHEGRTIHYIDGSTKNSKRKEIIADMENTDGLPRILVASYGTLSTGVSINAIFVVIFADSYKSEQIVVQSIGRSLRLHEDKKVAIIFDLVDCFDQDQQKDIDAWGFVQESKSRNKSNILQNQFKTRKQFYEEREYPYTIKHITLD